MITLYMLLMVVGVGLWVYIFLDPQGRGRGGARDPRAAAAVGLDARTLAIGFSLLAVVHPLALDGRGPPPAARATGSTRGAAGSATAASNGAAGHYGPSSHGARSCSSSRSSSIAVVALYLSHRARRRRLDPLPEALLPVLADVLDETLDDLRAEADPRRAVIAAYARMERALGAYGLPRSPSEAPDEYLQRIFADLEVSRLSTSRLTALFSWAKFSGHDVAPEMKQEAIEALEAVREELRAAEILAEHERLAALAERRERAASA